MLEQTEEWFDTEGVSEDNSRGEAESAASLLHHLHPDPVAYPSLIGSIEPIGGNIRTIAEDFRVVEVPLYAFSGSGEHCYITLIKTNRTTLQARYHLAKCLGVDQEMIGFAGFKDRRAVTQQTFSVQGVRVDDPSALESSSIEICDITYHTNKLRTGHLVGNQFTIRIRDVREGSERDVPRMLELLQHTGLPNFYGPQRFGYFGDSYRVGHALLHRNPKDAIDVLLSPRQESDESFRSHFEAGRLQDALDDLPPGRPSEAALLHALKRHPGNYRAAARRIPVQMKRMFFSAYQSFLYNWALKERLAWGAESFAIPEVGDLAFLHRNGACFLVNDAVEAEERARKGEISPSGPVFGRRMAFPEQRPGQMEREILATEKLRPQSFLSHVKGLKLNGSRRPYRIPLKEVRWQYLEEHGERSIILEFALPAGSYATMLLEQLMGHDGRFNPDDDVPDGDVSDGDIAAAILEDVEPEE